MSDVLSVLSKQLHNREITSVELTKKYIRKIEETNPGINALVHTDFEKALAMAAEADRRLDAEGADAPFLCGIPFALKDNICSDGDLTTCCSKILEGFRPYYDATVYSKLKEQGAVLVGKANMDEFAMGSTSESSCYGAPKNPRDPEYVTGGSSGGSAAAVAAGMVPYALGSDTGGSIRQPASYCGVVGLKPTYGSVSRYGLIAYGSSLDQIGPLTTSVRDAAAIFDVIRGVDDRDNTSVDHEFGNVTDSLGTTSLKGLRIGVAEELFDGISPAVDAAIRAALDFYQAEGAEIVKLSIPALKVALPVYYIIACAEASSNLGRYDGIRYGYRADDYANIDDMIYKTRSEGFGKEVKKRIMLGTYVLSSGYYDAYYKKACIIRETINEEFAKVFADQADVLLAPVAPSVAPKLGESGKASSIEMYVSDLCTVPINIAGLPAISLPCGKDASGLPVGMQIIGPKFSEGKILDIAWQYEQKAGNPFAVEGGVSV
ncbi:MAG: Asp-tRNA(Asn)/Glu-tRNA(Gln) amidotransferase subunit GatA [Lachnospiraceae bacterium]|nr:Asp-tRNA(Asn)/Glu-tRNA(Gln) amidotransferase subunit GatA [Lachnospiraceae bacterium]